MSKEIKLINHLQKSSNLIHSPSTGWIILLLSLLLTFSAYHISSTQMQNRLQERFNYRTSQLTGAIEERLLMYEQSLWGAVGLFNASEHVDRQEWRGYVESLNLSTRLPGIQGLGYAIPVEKHNVDALISSVRQEGFPDFTIQPDTPREEYTTILYLEPFNWRNQRAFGYDMWSNPARRKAMKRAKEIGAASTSAMITLVQETDQDVQKGFLTYLPVYKKTQAKVPVDPSESKHSDIGKKQNRPLQGWVYAAFRMNDLMQGIGTSSLYHSNFKIYDGADIHDDRLLYQYDNDPEMASTSTHTLSKEVPISLQGHRWTLVFSTPSSSLLSSGEKNLPAFILTAGIIIDALLFYVIVSLFMVNRHARQREAQAIEKNKVTQRYLKEQKRFARDAKEEAQLYFELAPVAFIISDQQGNIISANKMAHSCFYSEDSSLLKATLSDLFEQKFCSITQVQSCVVNHYSCPHMFNEFSQDNIAIRLNGERFPAHIQQVPIALEGRTLIATVIQDITEQQNHANQMSEAMKRAEQASQSKTEFVANMSHEIRTPMNAIIGASQLLDKTTLDIQQCRYNRMIRSSSELLLSIINDILDFSKIEAGHMSLEETPFDLDEFLTRISAMLTVIVGEKPLEVAIIVDPTIEKLVIGDPIRLQQIAINLLSNAVKFTQNGAVTLTLERQHHCHTGDNDHTALAHKTHQHQQHQHLKLCVTDSGIGMNQEQMDCLFKAFKQADGTITRRFGGSGLGLTITKSLIDMMGGTISVHSEIDQGSTFEINVSILKQGSEQTSYTPTHPSCAIIIEPFAQHRKSLANIFESWNWKHHCLESLQAFEQWDAKEPEQINLVLIDSDILSAHLDQITQQLLQKGVPENVLLLVIASNHLQSELTLANHTQVDAAIIRPAVPFSLRDALQEAKPHTPDNEVLPDVQDNQLSLKGIKILLVEDNELNQVITQEILSEYGIEVLIANNGQEALNMLEECQETIDLVLMDHHMPVMDGVTATVILRKEKSFKKPIIALTAGVMRSEQDEYLSAGMNAVVPKPIEAQLLLTSIKKAVA